MRLLKSLSRGLLTLDYMREAQRPIRLTDLARYLGVEKSNALHIAKTLVMSGYAVQDVSRHYLLTEKALPRLEDQSLSQIIAAKEHYHPALKDLVCETQECAHMAVLVHDRVWYIDKIDSELPLKVDHPIGSLYPLHCTALGKAFLTFGKAKINGELKRYTPLTITKHEDLKKEIAVTLARGFAIDNEEYAEGVRCAARPVYGKDGEMIIAMGVSGPSVRIDNLRLQQLGETVGRILSRHVMLATEREDLS